MAVIVIPRTSVPAGQVALFRQRVAAYRPDCAQRLPGLLARYGESPELLGALAREWFGLPLGRVLAGLPGELLRDWRSGELESGE